MYDAFKLGRKHKFPILLGEEFYFEGLGETRKNGHLILIAKSEKGLANIYKLQELAYRNFYYKPRLSMGMLRLHHEDLVCTTACIANQANQFILAGEYPLAIGHIKELQHIFGDDLYVELQSSTMDDVVTCNKKLEEFCVNYNFKPIITNDVHYVNEEDYAVHEVMLAIQQQQKMDSPKRWKFERNDYWLKSQEEMEKYVQYLIPGTIDRCYANIEEIFNKCSGVEMVGGNYLPHFENMSKDEEDEQLETLTKQQYISRVTDRGEANDEFSLDLDKELNVIRETGYSGYYLIVQEYINWAKQNNILVGDGRGSGAGSKVAYTVGITEINPQQYDLLFERFLCPGRTPDFDVDFSDIDAVFKHLQDRYGENNVARVGAFNRFTCKSALRKVMGIYSFPMSEISEVVAMLPSDLHFTLADAIRRNPNFEKWLKHHKNIYLAVEKLEGVMSHYSTHAGGVVICENLASLMPVTIDTKDKDKLVIAYDKKIVEELGHYKFDILGLNSLTLMKDALEYLPPFEWHDVDFEDSNVYDLLCEGDVLGVFQLSDQKDKVVEQQPRSFEDLIAINALIRPGVGDWNEYIRRRKARDKSAFSKGLPYMQSTTGIIVYQEQYLLLANTYAGWDIAYADNNIRKNKDILGDVELEVQFYNDCANRGYQLSEIGEVWNNICSIVTGGYGFNRSHSCSYAKLSYQTAYMKCYHPNEFYSAYMTQNFDDATVLQEVMGLLKAKGVKLLPPNINKSADKFIPSDEGILFPLTSIKGVGGSVLYEINRMKPISSLEDFIERRVPKFVKKTAITALIKAGAFDFTGRERFDMLKQFDDTEEEQRTYIYEKESLGFYLSESPFDKFSTPLFANYKTGDYLMTIVEVSKLHIFKDKNGNEMAFVTGVNKSDTIKLVIFASTWKTSKCKADQLILVKGKKDKESLLVNSIEVLT